MHTANNAATGVVSIDMGRKTESKIQDKARRLAFEWLGIRSSKFEGASENGKPDVIFWLPLKWGIKGPYLVEFKKPGEVARPLQEHKHNQWRELGYDIEVHSNEFTVIEALLEKMDTPKLPKAGREILVRARRRLALARSRIGQDR